MRMEKNERGKTNALDLVEILITIVLGWIGKKLLDSLWKGVISAIRKILAGRNSNEVSRHIMRELGDKTLVWVADMLGIDEEQHRLIMYQTVHTKGPSLLTGINVLARYFKHFASSFFD